MMTIAESALRQPATPALIDDLIGRAGRCAHDMLSTPGAAARLRQIGTDGLSPIQRLELSPSAFDQFVAVALRLAGWNTSRGDAIEHLRTCFGRPPASIEVEAERRTIWQGSQGEPVPVEPAQAAVAKLERAMSGLADPELSRELARWAALYADLWCDPRLGASADARRVMLAMVSVLHERSRGLVAEEDRSSGGKP
jgi:hypothetical protein